MSAIEIEKYQAPLPAPTNPERIPICSDLDDDCKSITDPLACWLYDMGKGLCPYCSSCKPKN